MLKQKYFPASIFILSTEKTANYIFMVENRMITKRGSADIRLNEGGTLKLEEYNIKLKKESSLK